jgi:prepilin-type N-terminal cleavage/methylation domain-containing protein
MMARKTISGFTLIEMLLTVAIIAIAAGISAASWIDFGSKRQLYEDAQGLAARIRATRGAARGGEGACGAGIFIDPSEKKFTAYRGENYPGRDPAFDKETEMGNSSISSDFAGGDFQFGESTGLPSARGTITIRNRGSEAELEVSPTGAASIHYGWQ